MLTMPFSTLTLAIAGGFSLIVVFIAWLKYREHLHAPIAVNVRNIIIPSFRFTRAAGATGDCNQPSVIHKQSLFRLGQHR